MNAFKRALAMVLLTGACVGVTGCQWQVDTVPRPPTFKQLPGCDADAKRCMNDTGTTTTTSAPDVTFTWECPMQRRPNTGCIA